MKKNLLTLICVMSINIVNAQIVNIPDAIFKSRLVNNAAINTNGDGEIQVTEAAAFNGYMNVRKGLGSGIADLTGIETFTAITGLDCSRNQLTSLHLSANTAITTLYCDSNQLTSLDLSSNTALTELRCPRNQLASLNVSANSALNVLDCGDNQLTSLNVSSNAALTWLYCSLNPLTLGLNVSANTALTKLWCAHNQLTDLDVSANTALTVLACGTNLFTSINVQNGNNSNFTYFDAINNPNLTCIQVDNVTYSNANWTFKDAIASYSTNCGALSVPDIGNSAIVQIAPNPATNHFTIALPNANEKVEVTITTIPGKIIYRTSSFAAQKLEVNTEDFSTGVYLVQVQAADFIGTKKLVIEK